MSWSAVSWIGYIHTLHLPEHRKNQVGYLQQQTQGPQHDQAPVPPLGPPLDKDRRQRPHAQIASRTRHSRIKERRGVTMRTVIGRTPGSSGGGSTGGVASRSVGAASRSGVASRKYTAASIVQGKHRTKSGRVIQSALSGEAKATYVILETLLSLFQLAPACRIET